MAIHFGPGRSLKADDVVEVVLARTKLRGRVVNAGGWTAGEFDDLDENLSVPSIAWGSELPDAQFALVRIESRSLPELELPRAAECRDDLLERVGHPAGHDPAGGDRRPPELGARAVPGARVNRGRTSDHSRVDAAPDRRTLPGNRQDHSARHRGRWCAPWAFSVSPAVAPRPCSVLRPGLSLAARGPDAALRPVDALQHRSRAVRDDEARNGVAPRGQSRIPPRPKRPACATLPVVVPSQGCSGGSPQGGE